MVLHGTSQEGFDAEWRIVELLTVEGDLVNRCEIFDEADIDAALARFDELTSRSRDWKTRQAKSQNAFTRTSRPATGSAWRKHWPTTFAWMTVVRWWALASDAGES